MLLNNILTMFFHTSKFVYLCFNTFPEQSTKKRYFLLLYWNIVEQQFHFGINILVLLNEEEEGQRNNSILVGTRSYVLHF